MSQTWKPPVPRAEKVTRVTVYAKPGWAVVTAFVRQGVEVYPRRYYIPIQRKPQGYELETHEYKQWKKRDNIEPWLAAVAQYIDDIATIIDFAAAKTVEKLREFNVAVSADENGLVRAVGIDLGDRVVPLGPPPELIYTSIESEIGGGWAIPAYKDYIRTLVYTAMWKDAVKAAGCEVWYRQGGLASVVCGGGEIVTERPVLPLDEVEEEGYRMMDGAVDALMGGL